ncbi:MAG: hypothetical protein M1838_002149, partial [Thelocarpon superellum]
MTLQGEKKGYLSQIYPDEGADQSIDVDIVAVHGLATDSTTTWIANVRAEDGSIIREVNWLCDADMLPHHMKRARVLTFNYDSAWNFDAPAQRLLPLAEVLMTVLLDRRRREDILRRPVLFIASSLGGLVVAQAIERASQMEARYKQLLRMTVGVIFLGSPLRGTPYASATKWLTMIAGILGRRPSETLIRDLNGQSGVLDDLLSRFASVAQQPWFRLQIRCFFEMKKTQVINAWRGSAFSRYSEILLVDGPSACIPGYASFPLNVSHSGMNKFPGPHDGNYNLVIGRIEELVQDAEKILQARAEGKSRLDHPLELLPFVKNNDMVFRKDIFAQLERQLPLGPQHQEAALWGLGGSGKTQIALEFAFRRRIRTPCSLFWVHADTFIDDYSKIARLAGLSPDTKRRDSLLAIRRWLEHQKNYLLVIDNADDLDLFARPIEANNTNEESIDLTDFIPRGFTGSLLYTSRDEGIVGSIVGIREGIEVQGMTEPEALEMFRALSSTGIQAEATTAEQELLASLERLPLAIAQAAAYIRKTRIPLATYVEKLNSSEEWWSQLLDKDFRDRHRRSGVPNSVMKTWHISMEQVARQGSHAKRIFNTIVFFGRQEIPFSLLHAAAGPESNELDILEAVARFREFSFLHEQKIEGEDFMGYELHPLVQKVTRLSLDVPARRQHIEAALKIMREIFPSGRYGTWPKCQIYLQHVLKSLTWVETDEEELRNTSLKARVGMYLLEQ